VDLKVLDLLEFLVLVVVAVMPRRRSDFWLLVLKRLRLHVTRLHRNALECRDVLILALPLALEILRTALRLVPVLLQEALRSILSLRGRSPGLLLTLSLRLRCALSEEDHRGWVRRGRSANIGALVY
jgi:hypothetical protein